jgi:predicted AAA+ superfamily ATPase
LPPLPAIFGWPKFTDNILDEAHLVPALFAALRGIIDQDRGHTGRFCILGSAQPTLIRTVSESLAGRVGILDLDPLCAQETATGELLLDWRTLWLRGGFPDAAKGDFRAWWESYLRTFVERDLPQLELRPQPVLLRRLLTMLAHLHGGLLNMSDLGNSLGISHHTVSHYLDVLEQTFLIRRLSPWFRNVGKRLTKSPKIYLRDSGLLHHLLNLSTEEELWCHPALGRSWEGFVLEEIVRREKIVHPHTQFYFWRTAAGAEADLVLDRGDLLIAIEIKCGALERTIEAKRFAATLSDIGAVPGFVLDQGAGRRPLLPQVECRGFADDVTWLQ